MHQVIIYYFIGDICQNFQTTGKCSRGLACRFGGSHITSDGFNIVDKEKWETYEASGLKTLNQLPQNLQTSLRKRSYDFSLSESLIKYNDKLRKEQVNYLLN